MLVKSAIGCWVPIPDLRTFLNAMPGPALTMTDVDQRMKDFELESHIWAREELKQGCLAIYAPGTGGRNGHAGHHWQAT